MSKRARLMPLTLWAIQIIATMLASVVSALAAPRLLLLHGAQADAILPFSLATFVLQAVWISCVMIACIWPLRVTLYAIDLDDDTTASSISSSNVARIDRLPGWIVIFAFLGGAVAAGLAQGFLSGSAAFGTVGAQGIDVGLALFVILAQGATHLLTFVILRRVSAAVLERIPFDAMRDAMDASALAQSRMTTLAARLPLASASCVALVAIGAGLLLYGHQRALEQRTRNEIAEDFARGVFEPANASAREQARGEAASLKWLTSMDMRGPNVTRDADESRARFPMENGDLIVHYEQPGGLPLSLPALLTIAALLAAALLSGGALGRAFENDLAVATTEVRALGASDVLRGVAVMHVARFRVVESLLASIDGLGVVFRQFAAAHARATVAKEKTERMRGLFLASMSHDLKGPLNAVLGFAELVRRGPLTAGQAESCAIIAQRGQELLHLVETVLDSARIEAGEFALSPDRRMIPELVEHAVQLATELTHGSGVLIACRINGGGTPSYVDSTRITQALVAVIMSAMRVTREGGLVFVESHAPSGPGLFRVRIESPAGALPQAELDRIFVAFRYAEQARKHGSLGLGLSLAKAIFEMHGGTIEVKSASAGVVFDLAFLATDHPKAPSRAPRQG